ncbi:uncharacterized protein ACNS7B_008374 isoform 1-T1 [Menidia menidia]
MGVRKKDLFLRQDGVTERRRLLTGSLLLPTLRQTMAPMPLLFLVFHLSFIRFSDAQTITGSSRPPLDLPSDSSPPPTKDTIPFWPSSRPRGRSDVPIKVRLQDTLTTTNAVEQERRITHPATQFNPSFVSRLPTQHLSGGGTGTQPTASRSRTDTARLLASSASTRDPAVKVQLLPTLPSTADETADVEAGSPAEELDKVTKDVDSQGPGSNRTHAAVLVQKEPPGPLPTVGDELAQYRPQEQTMISTLTDAKPTGPDSETTKTYPFVLTTSKTTSTTATTPQPRTSATPSPIGTQKYPQIEEFPGQVSSKNPSTDRVYAMQDSAAVTTAKPTSDAAGYPDKQPQTAGQPATNHSLHPSTSTPQATQTSTTGEPTRTKEADGTTSKAATQSSKPAKLGKLNASTTEPSASTGSSSLLTTSVPVIKSRLGPTYQAGVIHRNRSLNLDHPHQAPHATFIPAPSPSANPFPNGTLLYWNDLSRTLAFAWELHVYGSASLFLLLFAGAALGLTLAPGTTCPHRGALALANALLFLAGGLRAALFFIDPYGTRKFLPRPVVTALYNLPLHLLVWAQASLALLALRAAGVSVLPPTLERPPLVAVLAVLQSTLLLAADLLSPALSPVVPVTLQVLSLCWGLSLCLGFLCYVFPRIRCPPVPNQAVPDETRRKTWVGSRRMGVILGRTLAVCAVLGALCCGLHIHATLWLYGLLGDWTRFSWGWWLVHFWARLLELAWAFALLLLGSWVFWRPAVCRGREEGGQDGRAAADLPSPGQSAGSPQRHTCWSKIVQSLRGKPCRKSDSNGVGAPGEVPNNWAGQERPGADISKSLIRNQNHEQSSAQPRCVKDSNHGRNHRGHSAERGIADGSAGSLLRLQALGQPPHRSVSGSLDQERDTSLSFYEFDLRPPSPIDLTRSIDEALHREHLIVGGSLFHPLNPPSQSPSPGSGCSQGPWLRRNSDPQLLSESSDAPTESSMPLGGSILSSVPSRQVTAPPTPSHQGHRWGGNAANVPSSVSCPVSLRPSTTSTGNLGEDGLDDTRPFITPDSERARAARPVGSRSYLEVSRHDDSASVGSEIIDL